MGVSAGAGDGRHDSTGMPKKSSSKSSGRGAKATDGMTYLGMDWVAAYAVTATGR